MEENFYAVAWTMQYSYKEYSCNIYPIIVKIEILKKTNYMFKKIVDSDDDTVKELAERLNRL